MQVALEKDGRREEHTRACGEGEEKSPGFHFSFASQDCGSSPGKKGMCVSTHVCMQPHLTCRMQAHDTAL